MPFLDPAIISKLESLPIKAKVIVDNALTGIHRSRLHGSSVEFAAHKEYSPGDEVRRIDWKAYARFDRYYVKQYEQESQLTAYLLLDASASMGYHRRGLGKLEYASYLLAALAHLLIHQRDQVGLAVFGDPALERYIPPRARPTHLHHLLSLVEAVNRRGAAGAETAATAVDRVSELIRRRGALVALASDLFEPGERILSLLRRLRARRHDVVLFHILDSDELSFPFTGMTRFESLEDERKLVVNASAIRNQYERRLRRFLDETARECVTGGVEYHLVDTSQPVDKTLADFLSQRTGPTGISSRRWSF